MIHRTTPQPDVGAKLVNKVATKVTDSNNRNRCAHAARIHAVRRAVERALRSLVHPLLIVLLIAAIGHAAEEPVSEHRAAAQSAAPGRTDESGLTEEREILNPHYPRPAWKLWFEDESPVTLRIDGDEQTFAPAPENERWYPVFPEDGSSGVPALQTLEKLGRLPREAGSWDDCYISLDRGHSNLHGRPGQMIVGPKLPHARLIEPRFLLGANFTSQSYARRGRHIVDDPQNNLELEKYFFFANCVRASPAHASFVDNQTEQAHDDYDGLYGHAYQSVGQSSSEIHALSKMMLAGGCMPREMKNLLKRHGAYAIVLLTLFKATLPYTDAQGQELPYEHELRHRVAYSSHGDVGHPHWCSKNPHYHGYDDQLHLARMCQMARNLSAAPPVAILKCEDLTVEKGGQAVVSRATGDERIKSASLTNARIWGHEGETLSLRIDLTSSYDLQGKPLTFTCKPVYANQKNVQVTDLEHGRFELRVCHDPKLPKGRIPVICVARNGEGVPSNPVFVNFYWPEENERPDFFHFDPRRLPAELKKQIEQHGWVTRPVTVNLRPKVDFRFPGDAIRCSPGETVSFQLSTNDPEGYPVSVFRRTGEPGEIRGDTFAIRIPDEPESRIEKLHFVFSDGTGGHTGKEVKLLVSPGKDQVPDGWLVTSVGSPPAAARVSFDSSHCVFQGVPAAEKAEGVEGTFLCKPYRKQTNLDLVCKTPEDFATDGGAALGLMVRGGLDSFDRQACVLSKNGTGATVFRPREARWGSQQKASDPELAIEPRFLRLAKQEDRLSLYVSSDGKTWEQVQFDKLDVDDFYAGIIYLGSPATEEGAEGADCRLLGPDSPLPVVQIDAKPEQDGTYRLPLELVLDGGGEHSTLRYTLDGSDPTQKSPEYAGPITLEEAGRHEIRISSFREGKAGDTVVAVVTAKAAPADAK
jgi:hypothetical protein